MARFDWYQGTVPAEVPPLMAALSEVAEGTPRWEPLSRAPHGYGFGSKLSDSDGQVAMVWWGGHHPLPHVVSSGSSAVLVSGLLRDRFPGHNVSRADVCIDYAETGAYDRLQGLALGVARERSIRVGTAGDHLVTFKGRTLYLGAPTSPTRLRLYDKAEELRGKFAGDPRRLAEVPQELARLECQVRPQSKEAKAAAALVEPMVLMGSAAWMRELMRQVADIELAPFEAGKPWRQADDDRAYSAMLAQYGALLSRVCADLGAWDLVGRQIGDDLAEREVARRRRKG